MINQLVLMAGGKGTRLGKLSKKIPKCLIKINGKELLKYQIEFAIKHNIKEIIILTGYKHEKIRDFIKYLKVRNIKIKLVRDSVEGGTGNALIKNLKYFKNRFLLVYADLYHGINLKDFLNFHNFKNSKLSLIINKNNHPDDSNLIEINKSKKVKNIYFYPHNKLLIKNLYTNEAIFIIEKKTLASLSSLLKIDKFDFVKDLLPLVLNKINIHGYFEASPITDCGDLLRIKSLESSIKSSKSS